MIKSRIHELLHRAAHCRHLSEGAVSFTTASQLERLAVDFEHEANILALRRSTAKAGAVALAKSDA